MNKNFFIICITLLYLSLSGIVVNADEPVIDELAELTLKGKTFEQPYTNLNYNYEDTKRIPVKLKITKTISTKKDIEDGQEITFKVNKNVVYNKKVIIKEGTLVNAHVATYLTKGMNGIPATIIIENFTIPGIDKTKLQDTYIRQGLNLTPYVMPLKWALTPIPGAGSLTNFIRGGNAKISDGDTIEIYYYPNWSKK